MLTIKKGVSWLMVIATIVTMCMFVTPVSVAAASFPAINNKHYIETKAEVSMPVFQNEKMTIPGTSSPWKRYNARIDQWDEVHILKICGNGAVLVEYPTTSGTWRKGYVAFSNFFNNYPSEVISAKANATVYTAPYGSTYGTIVSGDTVYCVGESNGFILVMYDAKSNSSNRGYKLGYVQNSAYQTLKSNPTPALKWEFPMRNAYCTWRSASNMSWGSYNNNSGSRDYHLGIDIYGTDGKVYATAIGKVVACSTSNSGANGRYVIVEHILSNGKKVYSFYAHLSEVKVKVNQQVNTNTQIGVAGGSGYGKNNYYGRHLHFAIVDTLKTSGNYYGYATRFSGNKVTYQGVTFFNPVYVINNDRLP